MRLSDLRRPRQTPGAPATSAALDRSWAIPRLDVELRCSEPRSGRRLPYAADVDEAPSGPDCADATCASCIDSTGAKQTSVPSSMRAPIVARARAERCRQQRFPSPHPALSRLRRHRCRVDLQPAQQLGMEFFLDRGDRDELAVGTLIDFVEIGAGIENVAATRGVEPAGGRASHRSVSSATARRPPSPRRPPDRAGGTSRDDGGKQFR